MTLVQFHLEGADEDVDDEPVCVYDWRNKSMAASCSLLITKHANSLLPGKN